MIRVKWSNNFIKSVQLFIYNVVHAFALLCHFILGG